MTGLFSMTASKGHKAGGSVLMDKVGCTFGDYRHYSSKYGLLALSRTFARS